MTTSPQQPTAPQSLPDRIDHLMRQAGRVCILLGQWQEELRELCDALRLLRASTLIPPPSSLSEIEDPERHDFIDQ